MGGMCKNNSANGRGDNSGFLAIAKKIPHLLGVIGYWGAIKVNEAYAGKSENYL
jgi:hypothetical protein